MLIKGLENFQRVGWELFPQLSQTFNSPEQVSGWYPELVFLTVVFSNSTDMAVVFF